MKAANPASFASTSLCSSLYSIMGFILSFCVWVVNRGHAFHACGLEETVVITTRVAAE